MKRLVMLCSMVALVLGVMPLKVEAVSANDSTVSFGNYGSFAAGDISYEYTSTADGLKEWSFYLTVGSKYDVIYTSLVPNALEIQSIRPGTGFIIDNQSDGSNGVKNILIFNTSNGVTTGSRVLLFTVITKDTAETGCTLSVSPLSLACAHIDNNYFDKNGNQVNSEAEFNSACGTVTNDVPNADTGNAIPYVAVGGGLIAIAGLYFYSRKANKMYKI